MAALTSGPWVVDWLKQAGIELPMLTGVIIDIPLEGAVTIYLTGYADEKMFQVQPPDLSGAQIVRTEKAHA
jgi:hypothetical protein